MARPLSRRLSGAATDLAYLLLGSLPPLRGPYRRWAARRYGGLAGGYHRWTQADPTYLSSLAVVLRELDVVPARVVEVGAGTGSATDVLSDRYRPDVLVALDASTAMLSRLELSPRARVHRVAGDAFALPLRSGSADLVVVHNAPFDLEELLRVAGPRGTVVIILSAAAWIPAAIRGRLLTGRVVQGWRCILERAAGPGMGWVFRREAVSARRSSTGRSA